MVFDALERCWKHSLPKGSMKVSDISLGLKGATIPYHDFGVYVWTMIVDYICMNSYLYVYVVLYTHVCVEYIYICIWLRPKTIGFTTGPGGLFATRHVTELGRLATNPPRDKPIADCSTLHRGPRQKFVTQGPRQARNKDL